MKSDFRQGCKDGMPIAIGYLAVSFGLGIMMAAGGLSAASGTIMSLTNLTSAGEFAGVRIFLAGGTIAELILTQIIINLRYSLMSLSLSQKLSPEMTTWKRMIVAFGNTDEIFAVAMAHHKQLTFRYLLGLELFPMIGWTGGTLLGCVSTGLMPENVRIAMSVALYGMFIAIVVPVARKAKNVLFVSLLAITISCVLYYVPAFSFLSDGIGIILSTTIAAGVGALLFPIEQREEGEEK